MGRRVGGLVMGALCATLSLGGCRDGAGGAASPPSASPTDAAIAVAPRSAAAAVPVTAPEVSAPSPAPAAPAAPVAPAAPAMEPDLDAARAADGELLRAAGDGLVTVALWPDRLPALLDQVNRLVPQAALDPAALRTLLRDALTREVGLAEAELVLAVLSVEGLERHRPWVVSVFQPPERSPVAGAATAAWLAGTAPVLSHQAVLPTSAPAAVAERIGAHLAAWGQPEPVAAGWTAWRRGAQGPRVAVRAAAGFVRLTLETETTAPAGPTWTPATPAAAAHTTGLSWALAEPHAAAARLRTDQLRGWALWRGLAQLARALPMMPEAEGRDLLRAQAVGEMLSAERLMGATPPDLTEHGWAVRADPAGIRLRTVAVPHAHLRPAVAAATAAAPPEAFAWRGPAPVLRGGLAGDLAGLLKAHTPPAFWRPGLSAGALSEAFARCGHGCTVHVALRSPLSNLRGLLDLLAPELGGFDPAPRSLSWAVPARPTGTASGVVAAAAFAPGPPPPLARLGFPAEVTVQLARRGALPVLGVSTVGAAGEGAAGEGAAGEPPGFDLASAEPAPAALWLTAEVARLPELLGLSPAERAEAAQALAGLGTFTFQLRAQAGLWLGDGLLAARGQAFKSVASRAPELGADEAEGLPAALAICLDRTLEGAAGVLGAFAHIEPADRARFVFGEASTLKKPLACLAADVRTAPVAKAVRTELRAVLAAAAPGEVVPADFP